MNVRLGARVRVKVRARVRVRARGIAARLQLGQLGADVVRLQPLARLALQLCTEGAEQREARTVQRCALRLGHRLVGVRG